MAIFKRENRKTRHNLWQDAWVTFDGGFAKRNCVVLDLSTTGAKLQLKDLSATSAQNLGLALSKDVHQSTPCRVIWRRGSLVGVQFVVAA